jgi:tyrosine-protein phosphatase SIW14
MRITALAIALCSLTMAASAGEEPGKREGLPNFHRVNENLYRGGQPTSSGVSKLAEIGVKTIIDLRGGGERAGKEEEKARSLGMKFISHPLSTTGAPAPEDIRELLSVMEDPKNWPVFVHCQRGSDRTGTVIACYRIAHDGWTNERAKREAETYGMTMIQGAKKRFIIGYRPDPAVVADTACAVQ